MIICPFDAPFGAAVTDLNLSNPVTPELLANINRAFATYVVLCFRSQSFESPDQFLAAAQRLGEPMAPVTASYRLSGYDEIEELSNFATDPRSSDTQPLKRGGSWHTDHSNLSVPPKATMLYAIDVPASGGNTEFTSLTLAYAALPPAMKRRIRGLRVFEAYLSRRAPRKLLRRTPSEEVDSSGSWQPLVRRHPETGKAGLYLNPMRDDAIEGLSEQKSEQLLDTLYAHCDQVQFQYSHRWRVGDVLIWDNRCAWHRATFDFDQSQRRYLHRIMLRGTKPEPA